MILAAALTLLLAASGQDADAKQKLHEWELAVNAHQAGDRDPALRSIGAWTYDDLDLMRMVLRQRVRELRSRPDFPEFLKRAAILHSDLALLTFVPTAVEPPAAERTPRLGRGQIEPTVDVRSSDGRAEAFQRANPHWEFAMDMLDALPARPRDPFIGQWFSAIAAYFAREDNTADAMRLLERARTIVPDDPAVNYAEAGLEEKLGSARIQDFARVTRLPNGLKLIGVNAAASHFRKAEALLRKALAARPDFHAASLRLGHVLVEKREFDAALAILVPLAPKLEDRAAYYAYLFIGDAALALGRGPDARAAYEKAITFFERSQAARLGLGAALRFMGDRQGALDAMQFTLNLSPSERDNYDEPWWDYYEGSRDEVAQLLDTLRQPYRSARQ